MTKTYLASAAFAGAMLACSLGRADAQVASPAPSPAATKAPAPAGSPAPAASAAPTPTASPTPFKLITLSGSGDVGYQSVGGTDKVRFTNGAPSRIFDAATGPFFDSNGGRLLAPANNFNGVPDLQNANLQLLLNGSLVSAKIEGSFGTDADVIASNGQSRSGVNLTQAYIQLTPNGATTFIAGKFSTEAGAEVIEAPGNTNYSRSYLFGEAIPFTHTGARLSYALDNSKITLVAGANNGWDDWKFVGGKGKTLEGAILLTPSPGWALTLDTYNGKDFAVTGNSLLAFAPVYTNRMLYDSVLTLHPTGALTLIVNNDNGVQLADNGTYFPVTAKWNGIAGYVNYQFNTRYGLSLRKETFHDDQGFRTGIAQRLQSNTATVNFTPTGNYIFRLEYRVDTSDGPNFQYRGWDPSLAGRDHQNSIGAEAVVKFP